MSTYTLSWEEFLEFQRESWPNYSYASILADILPIMIPGFMLLPPLRYTISDASQLSAAGLWLLAVVLFLLAFSRFRRSVSRHRGVQEIRAEYDYFYLRERTFTFDAEKWTLQTESGTQEGMWTSLLSAVEWRSIVTLAVRDQITVAIPKRALNSEELERLRQITIKPQEKTWRFRMNLLDYLLTELPSLWRQHPVLLLGAHLAGIFCFAVIADDVHNTAGSEASTKWAGAGLFLFLTFTAECWFLLLQYLFSFREMSKIYDVGFSEKGVQIKTSKADCFLSWAQFEKARESMRCFLLFTEPHNYYTLPKHCLPVKHQLAVRELLRAKLAMGERPD